MLLFILLLMDKIREVWTNKRDWEKFKMKKQNKYI